MRDELLNLLIQKSNGTLNAEGSARIEQIIEQDPALLAEYEAWQAELPALKELAGLAGATSLNAPAMPDSIREELLEHLQKNLITPNRNWPSLNPQMLFNESQGWAPAK